MTNQEKEKYIINAIGNLNRYKRLDISLDKCVPIDVGMKVDISSDGMFCPASCLISNGTFDTGKTWEHDKDCGVLKLLDRPEGLDVDVCVKLRVAYVIFRLYNKFHR